LKFSTRSRYSLRAMVDLAMKYSSGGPIPLGQVAERQGLSEGYLEQLMTFLRKGGLVRSARGAQGGYVLSREPSRITAGDVIRCLEGQLSPTDCVNEDDPGQCSRAETCVTRMLWERVREAVAGVLDQTTLEDLCNETERVSKSRQSLMYDI
jgi:Rrf2 family transcriptional regulator, cysteine metabolism repressor